MRMATNYWSNSKDPNSNSAALTNIDGDFSISVPSDVHKLSISYVGFVSKEVGVTSGEHLKINMEELVKSWKKLSWSVWYSKKSKSYRFGWHGFFFRFRAKAFDKYLCSSWWFSTRYDGCARFRSAW